MLNLNFSVKCLGLVSPPHSVHDFSKKSVSCYILLTDQISLSDCFYFSRYWATCLFQLLVNQPATSYNLTKFAIFYHSPILVTYHNKSSTTHLLVTQYLESYNPLSMFPLSIHVS